MPFSKHKLSPHGYSAIELLVSIGVLLILLGLLLPALEKVRHQSRQILCAHDHKQLAIALSMYADNNRGQVPFAYEHAPDHNQWVMPNNRTIPYMFFDTASMYWAAPVLAEGSYPELSLILQCPEDWTSAFRADEQPEDGALVLADTPVDLYRVISRSFYNTPLSLREDFAIRSSTNPFKVARLSDVAYPSGKALLFEDTPFHDNYAVGYAYDPAQDADVPYVYMPGFQGRRMVAASDLSVELRAVEDAVPPVVPSWFPPMPDTYPGIYEEYIELQRNSVTFDYTRDGILGRDW